MSRGNGILYSIMHCCIHYSSANVPINVANKFVLLLLLLYNDMYIVGNRYCGANVVGEGLRGENVRRVRPERRARTPGDVSHSDGVSQSVVPVPVDGAGEGRVRDRGLQHQPDQPETDICRIRRKNGRIDFVSAITRR